MLDGQAGELPLQLAKARPGCQVHAQEQSTQHVSVREERGCEEERSFQHRRPVDSLLSALNPSLTAGVRTTVSLLRAFRIQLFITESVSRGWGKVKKEKKSSFYHFFHFKKCLIIEVCHQAKRTVAPQSHALAVSGLTAAIKTPTLR